MDIRSHIFLPLFLFTLSNKCGRRNVLGGTHITPLGSAGLQNLEQRLRTWRGGAGERGEGRGEGGRCAVPVPQVVVFSTPTPESIREAIDFPKLFHRQAAHSAKELGVREPKRRCTASVTCARAGSPKNRLKRSNALCAAARGRPERLPPAETQHPGQLTELPTTASSRRNGHTV